MRVGDDFRIRSSSELYELLNGIDVEQRINIQLLRWLGHVVRMEKDAPARRVFDAGICGSRRGLHTRRVGLLDANARDRIPGQSSKMKYEKYFFGDFLSADFWQKL